MIKIGTMIGRLFGKRYSKDYDALVEEERYDMATFVACKGRLGKEKVVSSAMEWYDKLLNERNPKLAYDVAVKFGLPEQYIKHAMVEELRMRALDIEDVSYKFMENAQALRAQADDIERDMSPDSGRQPGRTDASKNGREELKKQGDSIMNSCPLWEGYFFRAQDARRNGGMSKNLYYNIGLLIFENELEIGNEKYAELIANSYKIRKSDKEIIIQAVKNRKGNNNTNP